VVVRVERRFTHPVMKKTVRSTKKYYAMTRPTNITWTTSLDRGAPAAFQAQALGSDPGEKKKAV